MKSSAKRRWINRLTFVAAIAVGVTVFLIYINSHTPYDFSHLTPSADFGASTEFTSLGQGSVPGMEIATQNDSHILYINPNNMAVAVRDMRNGFVWHSLPPGSNDDLLANPFERNIMASHIGIRYYNQVRHRMSKWSYADSVANEQAELFSIPNGIRIVYSIGDTSLGINAIPPFMETERFESRVMGQITDEDDLHFVSRQWIESRDNPGFMQLLPGIVNSVINTNRMLEIFEEIEYTLEELEYDNLAAGVEIDITLDFFIIPIEFVLDGATLTVNVALDEIVSADTNLTERLELMPFFGAGAADEEGFIFVPSGSGGVIYFNNGKQMEEPFRGIVYGLDPMINSVRPQVIQTIRMPVLGIARENAAMLAHVYSGSALAEINADVAGRNNSFNTAWFHFRLRNSVTLDMSILDGTATGMTIVQPYTFTGDITVKYRFLAGDEANIGGMARAYQQFLVDEGVLTPLSGQADRSFYLDIIAAADIQRNLLGTPYMTTEVMTTLEDANEILNLLEANGINTVQMQFHGWFNRGLNHDAAKRINPVSGIGTGREMSALNQRLAVAGGGLYPAVNFQFTAGNSRNFNRAFEAARDPAGFIGLMGPVARDLLTNRTVRHVNDLRVLVSPGVLPFHIDRFIPALNNYADINTLALIDLGDILPESMYQRGAVDREHSRLIAAEQLERLQSHFPQIVIYGGNDYSLGVASHLIGVPTQADMFYIIDRSVPFYQMVVHGFIEYAGDSVNLREHVDVRQSLLTSLATGASPRYTWTAQPTRLLFLSPHERMYSTYYVNWIEEAAEHYRIFNDIYRNLRTERIVDFRNLADIRQVSVTVFSNGTHIYVNNTNTPFEYNGIIIEPNWFYVSYGEGF